MHGSLVRLSKLVLPSLALLLFAMFSAASSRADIHKHPVFLPANFNDNNCVECHKSLTEGKYVHTAMSMGCTTCHNVANVKDATYITLVSPVNQLCLMCHTLSSDSDLHPPYKEGNCVFCHSPHSSNFVAHLHAAPEEICMGCHVRDLLKVNRKTSTLTLPWGTVIPFKEMNSWFYLNLNKEHTRNHPVAGHPVSGPNTAIGKSAPSITCLSCHMPHASTQANMIIPKYKSLTNLCMSCHSSMFP